MARKDIRAEISGTVISVLVKVGDSVTEGDELAFSLSVSHATMRFVGD